MSRIGFASVEYDGLSRLRRSVGEGLNALVERLTRSLGRLPSDILYATLVGNTVMHHIFLGISRVGSGWLRMRRSLESVVPAGMYPPVDLGRVTAVGNAAGDGRRLEYVELSMEDGFQREFVDAMHFPPLPECQGGS